ncbi:MAG: hypothetical protein CMP91_02020 [Gammaproteobacteria bacterium]|nr:hypothetical protein [Gammaproteobacteria bacterium]MAY03233.1 hypothetical protein [Gammaproteobacteria bacterium]
MEVMKRNFTILIICLLIMSLSFIALSMSLASKAEAAEAGEIPMPVSINSLMVTMIDHSAHYIWDYAALEDRMLEEEWLAVEYYAIQLAAAGPMLTLGGTGEVDEAWVQSPGWTSFARDMSTAALKALNAAEIQDLALLRTAGDELLDSCLGCHRAFKPESPTEGVIHDPFYDELYHLFHREGEI